MIKRTQTALADSAPWLVATTVLALGFVFYHDLKAALGGHPQRVTAARTAPPIAAAASLQLPVAEARRVELPAGGHGHVYASARINGTPARVMVDTGATIVALAYDDARRAGIQLRDTDFTHRVTTANGTAGFAPIYLDRVTIGAITVHNVRAAVARPGTLRTSLLGMTFLNQLSKTEMRDGILILEK